MIVTILFASLHHVLAFALVALLAVELALLRPDATARDLRVLGRVDLAYGASFGLLVVVGVVRVVWTEKGAGYYLTDGPFWAKMGVLVVIALLSLPPTLRFIRWNRRLEVDASALPEAAEVLATRWLMWVEAALLPLVPVFAAMMARGV